MNSINPFNVACSSNNNNQPDETPSRCAGGCGFFGMAEQHGLCSYCYKGYLKAETEKLAKLEESLSVFMIDDSESDCDPTLCASSSCNNRKPNLIPFRCRCGRSFCIIHRLPEAHDCTFDFKKAGRVVIEKENPSCKADKMATRI